MSVIWFYSKEFDANPDYDLCGCAFGEYVDVIQNGTDSNEWNVTFANVTIASRVKGRDAAKKFAEDNFSDKDSVIKILTRHARSSVGFE